MTTAQVQEKISKSDKLLAFKVGDGKYYVESGNGKVCYKVNINQDYISCTCADYVNKVKSDPSYICKHIMAVNSRNGDAEVVKPLESKSIRINPQFIKNLQGKDFVLYSGLLDLAHQKGLIKLDVEIIQHPNADNGNEAVCRAVAETRSGEMYTDIGDASNKNTNRNIANHILRMASTRAKARALRDLTNIGMTCFEELTDLDDVIGGTAGKKQPAAVTSKKPEANQKPKEPTPKTDKPKTSPNPAQITNKQNSKVSSPSMSEAQERAMRNLAKRRGISELELLDMAVKDYGVMLSELTSQDASKFIRQLQSAA